MTPLLGAIFLYLAVQFGIGLWVARRIHSESEYLIAGRSLGYPLATFTIFATWFGAETIVGSGGQTFTHGVSFAAAEPFGYGLCLVLMGLVFAAPLWRRGLTTLADLFRTRFSSGVERLAAIVLIPGSILWAAAQVRAFGHVVASASTLEVETGIAIAAGFVVAYTIVGGLLADAMTDLLQGIVLVLGLVVVGVAVTLHLGGPVEAARVAFAPDRISVTGGGELTLLAGLEEWLIPICGSVVAAELVQRVIATRTPTIARRSALMAGGLYLTVGVIPVFIGLAGAGLGVSLVDPEQVVPSLARELLPPVLYVLFAGALISAILSTVDSTLLVAAGLLSHNLVAPALRLPEGRSRLILARAAVLVCGIGAYLLAHRAEGVFALVEQASAFGSAGVVVTVTFGLFTSWGGPRTAYATLGVGVGVYVMGSVAGWPYPFLGSLTSALATYGAGATLEAGVRSGV
ncbi:MAG: sodium:solute symporter family protein, partial [Gemmatimonadales bacterium]